MPADVDQFVARRGVADLAMLAAVHATDRGTLDLRPHQVKRELLLMLEHADGGRELAAGQSLRPR
ncbi:MAG TPA: hypothetical protein VF526_17950 [Solirubrobacteraceae bacterium]